MNREAGESVFLHTFFTCILNYPRAVLILADYQYKNAFVADHELNVVACLTELMAEVEWK